MMGQSSREKMQETRVDVLSCFPMRLSTAEKLEERLQRIELAGDLKLLLESLKDPCSARC